MQNLFLWVVVLVVVKYYINKMKLDESMVDLLQSLGMNRLEAEIYIYLLQQPGPVTAYRAGQAMGKPTANVYKAVDVLVRKGAVMVEEGPTRLCRPAPPQEFLGQLETSFHARTEQAVGFPMA